MEAGEAVKIAKGYVGELLADEGLMNPGLEEIVRDESGDA